ncbi:hypothetical protein OF83DRAFT_1179368 [Amylostereum chailletii]|nr:hypothetical protein OF83DRAFT_1179368 [Amylostereum chailletii]
MSTSNNGMRISNSIFNNYRAALKLIDKNSSELGAFRATHGFDAEDFERWHTDEIAYLRTLKSEPDIDARRVAYVEALHNLDEAT